jgi:repressor LexA
MWVSQPLCPHFEVIIFNSRFVGYYIDGGVTMNTFGERLAKLRAGMKLSQAEMADRLNISKSALSMYELNQRKPDYETLSKISEYFNVTTDYLIKGKKEISTDAIEELQNTIKNSHSSNQQAASRLFPKIVDNVIDISPLVEIPIYGEIKAGYDMVADQNIIGYQIVARDDVKDGMIDDGIFEGSRVLVRRQNHVENGKIGVVLTNGDEATLKRVFYEGDNVILVPANKSMVPKTYGIYDVQIQGQVKSYTVDV